MSQVQISAYVSEETKQELDALTRARGLKKSFVVEQALLAHLQALKEVPEQFWIPPRIVLSKEEGQRFVELLEDTKPTAALEELMRSDGD